MTSTQVTRTAVARLRRTALVVAAVVVVAVPILVGLVLAWQVHWALVVPAYLLGIPAWLTAVSGAWALVRRVRPARQPQPEPQPAPVLRTELRLPAPRVEGAGVRTPTP